MQMEEHFKWIFRLENAIYSTSCHVETNINSRSTNCEIRNKERTPDFQHMSDLFFNKTLSNGQRYSVLRRLTYQQRHKLCDTCKTTQSKMPLSSVNIKEKSYLYMTKFGRCEQLI